MHARWVKLGIVTDIYRGPILLGQLWSIFGHERGQELDRALGTGVDARKRVKDDAADSTGWSID